MINHEKHQKVYRDTEDQSKLTNDLPPTYLRLLRSLDGLDRLFSSTSFLVQLWFLCENIQTENSCISYSHMCTYTHAHTHMHTHVHTRVHTQTHILFDHTWRYPITMQLQQVFETQITSLSLLNSYCQPNTLEVPQHQRAANPKQGLCCCQWRTQRCIAQLEPTSLHISPKPFLATPIHIKGRRMRFTCNFANHQQ